MIQIPVKYSSFENNEKMSWGDFLFSSLADIFFVGLKAGFIFLVINILYFSLTSALLQTFARDVCPLLK